MYLKIFPLSKLNVLATERNTTKLKQQLKTRSASEERKCSFSGKSTRVRKLVCVGMEWNGYHIGKHNSSPHFNQFENQFEEGKPV